MGVAVCDMPRGGRPRMGDPSGGISELRRDPGSECVPGAIPLIFNAMLASKRKLCLDESSKASQICS